MTGLTASQKDELLLLRRQSNVIQQSIEQLKRCKKSMIAIRGEVQIQTKKFQKNSPHDRSHWRGSISKDADRQPKR